LHLQRDARREACRLEQPKVPMFERSRRFDEAWFGEHREPYSAISEQK
jgi:hypothetical protein